MDASLITAWTTYQIRGLGDNVQVYTLTKCMIMSCVLGVPFLLMQRMTVVGMRPISGFFSTSRGSRERNPLLVLQFFIVMDAFSRLLGERQQRRVSSWLLG